MKFFFSFKIHCLQILLLFQSKNGSFFQTFAEMNIKLSYITGRVSRSLKKGQGGGHSEKGHMVRVESFEKGTFCVRARAMRKRQKGYFQYNVVKH